MTNTELILYMLAEASAKEISTVVNPVTFGGSKKVVQQSGNERTGSKNWQKSSYRHQCQNRFAT